MEKAINPLVSVVMGAYNAASYIEEAVLSILNQSYRNLELIVVNDGSTDNTLSILKSIKDDRLIILENDKNYGIVFSTNKGIEAAKGLFIARMDSDDISLTERISTQVNYLIEHPEFCGVATRIKLIDAYGNQIGDWREDIIANSAEKITSLISYTNCIANPSMMLRAELFKKYKLEEKLRIAEDWGLWLDIIGDGNRISKINTVHLLYRQLPNSLSKSFNEYGVLAKVIRFLYNYLIYRIQVRAFRKFDFFILLSLLKYVFKFPIDNYIKPFLRQFRKLIARKPWRFFELIYSINSEFKLSKNLQRVVFVFPYYHIGGAEAVHLSIVESVKEFKPIVLFTEKSNGNDNLIKFQKVATCFDISGLANFPIVYPRFLKWLAQKINASNLPTVFGSNSGMFYHLLNYLNANTKTIDLIHAFVGELERGPEHWSLGVVDKISNRVFISHLAEEQMTLLYQQNNIEASLANRFLFIRNFTFVPNEYPTKNFESSLKVIYIGRGGVEKRVYLVAKAAKLLIEKGAKVSFHFIGDVEEIIPFEYHHYCNFLGVINNPLLIREKIIDASILVLTSKREGMPMVIFEAMAHGTVCLATNVGDIKNYIKNYETGFLIDALNEEEIVTEFVNKIELLIKNKALLLEMSKNSYSTSKRLLSELNFVDSYRNLILRN
jgi:glycosyltransferase involved in cell wall biosynthesis